MTVLSLFDGMSCGQQALLKNNIKPTYFASEIDSYAMNVTRYNFPETIFIGDVRKINIKELPKIDLLIGGSPCQNFSFAGKQKGMVTKENITIESLEHYLELKNKDFEFEGQSYLFWEFVRIYKLLKKRNPQLKFLLENVKMKNEFKSVIDSVLMVDGVLLNSSDFSAQNRERYYWTNIVDLKNVYIEKLDINIRDIVSYGYDDNVKIGHCQLRDTSKKKSICYHIANATDISGNESIKRVYHISKKCPTLTTMQGGHREPKIYLRGNLYRKLNMLEMERIQTVEDDYTKFGMKEDKTIIHISNNQRKKMIGNGWTVDVIAFIFRFLNF